MKMTYYFDDYNDDEFVDNQNHRRRAYVKNAKDEKELELTKEEQEQFSNALMKTPCDYKNIFGYMALDKKTGTLSYVKYDKDKEFMAVYHNGKIVDSFHRSYRDFMGKMYDASQRYEYVDEIPRGQ